MRRSYSAKILSENKANNRLAEKKFSEYILYKELLSKMNKIQI